MLRIEYLKEDYKGCKIDVVPGKTTEIPTLRSILSHNFMIENPAKVFANKLKAGAYDDRDEDDVTDEAEVVNMLADLWDREASENVLVILVRALQELVNVKLSGNDLNTSEDHRKEADFEDVPEEILDELFNSDNSKKNN